MRLMAADEILGLRPEATTLIVVYNFALGNRSLLANPTDSSMRDRINHKVKHREAFRPFAPAILAATFETSFEGVPDAMTPYMTTVRSVLDPKRLGAVTHVDGTARVQSVSRPATMLHQVLGQVTVPAVLNTSLNGAGEPIAGTGVDALAFFMKHRVDALFVHDVEVTR